MNFKDRLDDICRRMKDEKLDLLVGLHDGSHFIEKPNPVMVLANFKALGASAAMLRPDGTMHVVVTPHWDAERAAECCQDARVVGADDLVAGVTAQLNRHMADARAVGVVGRSSCLAVWPIALPRRCPVRATPTGSCMRPRASRPRRRS